MSTREAFPGDRLPAAVGHADWGTAPGKRWVAVAALGGDGRYRVGAPEPVGEAGTLLGRLRAGAGAGATLVGFDFPIGLPWAYAAGVGIARFPDALPLLGPGDWAAFFAVAERPDEIGPRRPFYPRKPGGTRQAHLLQAHGVDRIDELRRRCERAHGGQKAAAPLFWTLGPQQVGKAAIAGWRDVLVPGARELGAAFALWPFDGPLGDLLAPGRVVVAETYPAEFYGHLGVAFARPTVGVKGGKRVRAARVQVAPAVVAWADAADVTLDDAARAQLLDGFGDAADGEDRFDALVGLCGMLNVVLGRRPSGEPDDPEIRSVEGWMLGMAPRPCR